MPKGIYRRSEETLRKLEENAKKNFPARFGNENVSKRLDVRMKINKNNKGKGGHKLNGRTYKEIHGDYYE